jgi:hypothetical protein
MNDKHTESEYQEQVKQALSDLFEEGKYAKYLGQLYLGLNDLWNDKLFHQIINNAFKVLEFMTVKKVAHEFGCSFPTVERWLMGNSSPHPYMRRPVYLWLEYLTKCQIVAKEPDKEAEWYKAEKPNEK